MAPLTHRDPRQTIWWRLLGGKTHREVTREVLQEPTVRQARTVIRKAEALLRDELSAIEGRSRDG